MPQNSLTDAGKVQWQKVRNVTALFRVPNITSTDNTIYLVMSLMTSDGAVIQVAAGIYRNMSSWGTYGMDIIHPTVYPQQYTPALDTGEPEIAPGHMASLSLYESNDTWNQKLVDLNSGKTVDAPFQSAGISSSLKAGDQFVIALESYTSNKTIFESMGNITLESIIVDGARVSGGAYAYSGWDNVHYPLFSVGGASPPSFVTVQLLNNGSAVWSYGQIWSSSETLQIPFQLILIIAVVVAVLIFSLVALLLIQRSKSRNYQG